MKVSSDLQTISLTAFISSLIICVLVYIFLYVFHLSKPVYLRVLFTIASFSVTAFAFYGFSSLLSTEVSWLGKIGLIVAGLHFILLLYTIWSAASFLAHNWLFLEISIGLILLAALAALLFKYFFKN